MRGDETSCVASKVRENGGKCNKPEEGGVRLHKVRCRTRGQCSLALEEHNFIEIRNPLRYIIEVHS